MTSAAKLNEFNHAEDPARRLLERLGWNYVLRETLVAERLDERDVLLKGRLYRALLRLNEWLTEEQAGRAWGLPSAGGSWRRMGAASSPATGPWTSG